MSYRNDSLSILLVEDNPGDVRLMKEALKDCAVEGQLTTVHDGVEALDYLHRRGAYQEATRPDLIFLDLNLPKLNGVEVLAEIKQDCSLRRTPVVILSTSSCAVDIDQSYDLHANCYVTKPIDFEQFVETIKRLVEFWFHTAST